MKLRAEDRTPVTGPDGHSVRELMGHATLNIEKFSLAQVVVPAGSEGSQRTNSFDEVIIVIEGQGVARLDFVSYDLAPEDVVYLPAGTRYAFDAAPEGDLRLWALCVPAFRPEQSQVGSRRDWREYQVPRGADRLREKRENIV